MAASFFPPMYRRATRMQAGLAVVGTAAGLFAWLTNSGWPWLLGAPFLGFVVPFALLVIKPINNQLLASDFDPSDPERRICCGAGVFFTGFAASRV